MNRKGLLLTLPLLLIGMLQIVCGGGGGGGNGQVSLAAPAIAYSPIPVFTVGTGILPITPTNTGGSVTSWSISPALPAELAFNTSTGEITGTPTVASPATTYAVTATNAAGPGNATLSITVNDSKTPSALPQSYCFTEYQFPESNDHATPTGIANDSATIQNVYFAQTHSMEPGWPFFFLIADRPALLEVIVTGTGASPDVVATGALNGVTLGSIYLKGPATLPSVVPVNEHRFDNRFTATLPAAWMQPALSVEVHAGNSVKIFTKEQLNLGAAPEINLLMLPFDILDFNNGKQDVPMPPDFLANFAGAMPASKVRFGTVPARMKLPTMVVSSDTDPVPVVLESGTNKKGVPDGNINAVALRFLDAFKKATGDYSYCFFYGNTENFFPGGWGGGKSFVSADFGGVLLHEMGHGLSLPHWGAGDYGRVNPTESEYCYPYGGISNDGGGRGETWNYYQNIHEFISPLSQVPNSPIFGQERSDAMQRNHSDLEMRSTGPGPWDGFGDFSAIAMFRYMTGASNAVSGTVPYRGGSSPYQLPKQSGFPTLKLDNNGKRELVRQFQPEQTQNWERYDFLVPQKWDTPVYTVYGSYHTQYTQANIIYDPMVYIGNLPRTIDPTDPFTFSQLANRNGIYDDYFWWEKDLTFKFTYADGSVRYALYPYGSVPRDWAAVASPWRSDLLYFAINIPADKKLSRIELYKRSFCVRNSDMTDAGNIMNPALGITAANFMSGATLVLAKDVK